MTHRRQVLVALGAAGITIPFASFAQQKGKVWRIGFLGALSATALESLVDVFRAGLRDLGHVEGRDFVMEYRWADDRYEKLPELAAELVRARVDVIITQGTPGARAAKQATTTIPIVMAIIGDPVSTGVVASIGRPEGNITGSAFFNPELAVKRVELFKEALPGAKRVGVLVNPDNLGGMANFKAMRQAAASRQLELRLFEVRGQRNIEGTFAAMAKTRLDGVLTTDDSILIANAATVAKLAKKARLPSVGFTELADAGGLISYGVNRRELYRRAAYFVDRIFKGSKPADLPIEQAARFEIVVNMGTAKALGVEIPRSILVRADRVIE